MDDMWPRHHAVAILKLKTKEQRREYLETRVPSSQRAMVRAHVEKAFIVKNERSK